MNRDNRRLAIVHVSYGDVLCHFGKPFNFRYATFSSNRKELPPDVDVVSVHEDHCSRCFAFTITHPSFAEVPVGAQIPLLFEEPVDIQIHELQREADGRYRITPDLPLQKIVGHAIDVGATFGHWDKGTADAPSIKRSVCAALDWVHSTAMRTNIPSNGMMLAMSLDDAKRLEQSEELTVYNLAHGVERFRHLKVPTVLYSVPVNLNCSYGPALKVTDGDTHYQVRFTNVFSEPWCSEPISSSNIVMIPRDQIEIRGGLVYRKGESTPVLEGAEAEQPAETWRDRNPLL